MRNAGFSALQLRRILLKCVVVPNSEDPRDIFFRAVVQPNVLTVKVRRRKK